MEAQIGAVKDIIDNNNCEELRKIQEEEGPPEVLDEDIMVRAATWIAGAEDVIKEAGESSSDDLMKLKDLVDNPPEVDEQLGQSLVLLIGDCVGLGDPRDIEFIDDSSEFNSDDSAGN